MRIALAAAILCLSSAGSDAAPRGVGLGFIHPQVCASGYHPDAGGNCQPATPEYDRYCPAGTVFHPFPDGWTCNPAPPEAY